MSDSQDEFKPKDKFLSKDQHLYGIFTEAYSKPSFGRGQKRPHPTSNTNKTISFKSGEKIETYSDKIEITHYESSKKKPTSNQNTNNLSTITNTQPIIEVIDEPVGQQIFTLESLMSTLNNNQMKNQIELIQQKIISKGFTENTKQLLKLRKFQKQKLEESDYLLPTEFGKKPKGVKTIKSAAEVQKSQEFAERYGVGYRISLKMGFTNITKGLGKNEDGILNPVESISKQAFIAVDDEQVVGEEEEVVDEEEEVEENARDKKVLELFTYFSEDSSINSILKALKEKYQSSHTRLSIVSEQISSYKGQLEIQTSHAIQRESELKQQSIRMVEHTELRADPSTHPHLALKFDVDLLIVQEAISKINRRGKFESVYDFKFAFEEIRETGRKLEQIYLEKEKQNLRGFVGIGLKRGGGSNNLEDGVSVSEEDKKKIGELGKLVFEETVMGSFDRLVGGLNLYDDKQSQTCIEILKCIGKIDQSLQEHYLTSSIYPLLNDYLTSFTITQKLPHLVIFPWFPVISPSKLNWRQFAQKILDIEWTPDTPLMYDFISPWKKYIDSKVWGIIVGLGVAPRLLLFLRGFEIKAEGQNSENLLKLKGFIRYSSLLGEEYVEGILEDAVLPRIRVVYGEMKGKGTGEGTREWLGSWEKVIKKIVGTKNVTAFFESLKCD